MEWAYGVTTVDSRKDSLLPQTLASLKAGGFGEPVLFVDGANGGYEGNVVYRYPRIGAWGNWFLGICELCIRNPRADYYAMFQDDIITYPNLRQYIERSNPPKDGYLNLFSSPGNESVRPKQIGWFPARKLEGTNSVAYESGLAGQGGKGALGLAFSREALLAFLSHPHCLTKPFEVRFPTMRIDGCVVTAMNKAGWKEYVHNPSLVQHCGDVSTLRGLVHKQSTTFRGESFDALELLL